MRFWKKRAPALTREAALSASPRWNPHARVVRGQDESVWVVLQLTTSKYARWFGAPKHVERRFELDTCGRQVYEACDGRTTVREIVRNFGQRHGIASKEVESSVARYLYTLMRKGLVEMHFGAVHGAQGPIR